MIRLTKIFTFETAHALWGYDGKCKNIHGHSYKLYVTIKGNPLEDLNHKKNGMVMDFGDLKSIIKKLIIDPLDHAILLNVNSKHKELGEKLLLEGHKVVFTPYQPTCENMLLDFASKISSQLPEPIVLAKLKLFETETSYGEWILEDQ
ncbi:6-carboxytetrahydropterin synthase [Apibacter muscae]|uniref:6-carboxy-5,6,7,8-tetrahydropterin synthase n=1 Tax=Apibacter muscae TaxID=2509004 RepID=A0A563DI42_9FLAO|nr:6-carboxytetrahydropterin synthase [Apibacter muscae]TWP24694.1 6-carboxytetrahydropterin synthase [Apibacter muscae]TWP29749.1 6-carboxytetrahydropterin synthase [Apibacter muscae]